MMGYCNFKFKFKDNLELNLECLKLIDVYDFIRLQTNILHQLYTVIDYKIYQLYLKKIIVLFVN